MRRKSSAILDALNCSKRKLGSKIVRIDLWRKYAICDRRGHWVLVGVLLGALSCGGARQSGAVRYADTAAGNYQKGQEKIRASAWIAARKYFTFVKARFPYSKKYAALAELRIADVDFGAGLYLQAADNYKLFLKFHPDHEQSINGYAAKRIGESYYKLIPGDWWILPPGYEKDQAATKDARRHLSVFLERYPNSSYRSEVRRLLAKVNLRLARHEWYVAQFYWKRGKTSGTVLRLRRLLERYPGVGLDGDALWLLGRAYVKINMPDRARKVWHQLVTEHPRHGRASDARRALRKLSG